MSKWKAWHWILIFASIFMLTQDYLFTSWSGTPTLLGLPAWMIWFAAIHLLFIGAFYFFGKKHWEE